MVTRFAMSPMFQQAEGAYRFSLYVDFADRVAAARRLIGSGYVLPFSSFPEWSDCAGFQSWFLEVANDRGELHGGTAIHVLPINSLPGYRILRVQRLGVNVATDALEATFRVLRRLAYSERRVLRLELETFSSTAEQLELVRTAASRTGLAATTAPREYARTLLIPLHDNLDSILASLHPTARRHIRAAAKKGLAIRPIADTAIARQLDDLLRETLHRTAGEYSPPPWNAIIRYSNEYPRRSRIVGLFSPVDDGERLLAFAWGCSQGDSVEYCTAGSTRSPDIRVPLGYALAWDLIAWAHSLNVRFFDFGGITDGDYGSGDPVGGISDFKRYFGGRVVECGCDWHVAPSRITTTAARLVSLLARKTGLKIRRVRLPSSREASTADFRTG